MVRGKERYKSKNQENAERQSPISFSSKKRIKDSLELFLEQIKF